MYRKNLEAGRIFYGVNRNVTIPIEIEEDKEVQDKKTERREVKARYITRSELERQRLEIVQSEPSQNPVTEEDVDIKSIIIDILETYNIEVDKEEELFSFDTQTIFSGLEKPYGKDKVMRKVIGLPMTKQLVYFSDIRDAKSVKNVNKYRVVKLYEISDRWATLEIELDSGEKVLINSMYLMDMQKSGFIDEMRNQCE